MKAPVLLYSLIALTISVSIIQADNSFAGKKASCPAFNAGMVDAAAMAFNLYPGDYASIAVEDDPAIPVIYCMMVGSPPQSVFSVEVNYLEPNYAAVNGRGVMEDDPDYDTRLNSAAGQLSPGQMHACRSEILRSFVWKNYCSPSLP